MTATTTAQTCSACHERLTTYYTAGDYIVVCPACREQILASSMTMAGWTGRLLRAGVVGAITAIIAGMVWYAFTRVVGWGVVVSGIATGVAVGGWTFNRHKPVQFSGPFTVTATPAPPGSH